ncbi:PREDICTED: uncharacterized protein LOC105556808 [Vollenhovia emeryi]|uniref:uncharacterized protein LOC105556808 n=1 Tax=Vollenhovia emeryi TaxID=411798 RepID=UPI0005F37ED7|nr:PREDICTED: uncharacterized protein LOC105556808 [Vollenhovia emeryi]
MKKRLKRDAVPIHFEHNDNFAQSKQSRQNEIDRAPQNSDKQIQPMEENAISLITPTTSATDPNILMDEQPAERLPLRTYQPSKLHFDISEEDDIMEWVCIEPPESERIDIPIQIKSPTLFDKEKLLDFVVYGKQVAIFLDSEQYEDG